VCSFLKNIRNCVS